MYAPTWRDNQFYASGRYRFDLRLDLERAWQVLGPDHVLLIRGHHHLANDVTAGTRRGFALNVTGYPNIAELFLITDVLITDYSSVMFDFAVTGRPMLFFTYDLEQLPGSAARVLLRLRGGGARAAAGQLGGGAGGGQGHRRGDRRLRGRLPGVRREVLPAGRRQGRRADLRPAVRQLTGPPSAGQWGRPTPGGLTTTGRQPAAGAAGRSGGPR